MLFRILLLAHQRLIRKEHCLLRVHGRGLSVLLVEIPVLSQDLQRLADLPRADNGISVLQMLVEMRPPGLHATQTGSGMQSHIN